ncbi:MAG: hypothetical protein KAT56_09160 [Sedimentisphaerales bacterium]|nr:hypothetical protein [Sedimentisphaerales bacterium]
MANTNSYTIKLGGSYRVFDVDGLSGGKVLLTLASWRNNYKKKAQPDELCLVTEDNHFQKLWTIVT